MMYPVDSDPFIMAIVKEGVAKVRRVLGRHCVDLFLAHYRGSPADWDQKWYSTEVDEHVTETGMKFHIMLNFFKRNGAFATKYDYIWLLDSDLGLATTDIGAWLSLADESAGNIIGPTFAIEEASHFLDHYGIHTGFSEFEGFSEFNATFDSDGSSDGGCCQLPAPFCRFQEVEFVEMVAPMFRPAALNTLLSECVGCIQPHSDWGVDFVMCNFIKHKTGTGCTLVSVKGTQVVHFNGRKKVIGNPNQGDALGHVKRAYPQYVCDKSNTICHN